MEGLRTEMQAEFQRALGEAQRSVQALAGRCGACGACDALQGCCRTGCSCCNSAGACSSEPSVCQLLLQSHRKPLLPPCLAGAEERAKALAESRRVWEACRARMDALAGRLFQQNGGAAAVSGNAGTSLGGPAGAWQSLFRI